MHSHTPLACARCGAPELRLQAREDMAFIARDGATAALEHRVATECKTVDVMHESIEDRVGGSAVTEVRVLLIDRQMARDECRAAVVAVVKDLELIAHGIGAE